MAAGGDIAVSGSPPGSAGWTVGIASLNNPGGRPARYLLLHHAAASTSGDTEQYVEIDGKRYSHIVDPHTGVGLVGRMSVTVVGPNGLTVDPLTKVVAVLGVQKGDEILDRIKGVSALTVLVKGGKRIVTPSKHWPEPAQQGHAKDG